MACCDGAGVARRAFLSALLARARRIRSLSPFFSSLLVFNRFIVVFMFHNYFARLNVCFFISGSLCLFGFCIKFANVYGFA